MDSAIIAADVVVNAHTIPVDATSAITTFDHNTSDSLSDSGSGSASGDDPKHDKCKDCVADNDQKLPAGIVQREEDHGWHVMCGCALWSLSLTCACV